MNASLCKYLLIAAGHTAQASYRPKAKLRKIPWSSEESAIVLAFFTSAIKKEKIPGKREIQLCVEANPCLRSRSWTNIKDFVRNYIVKIKKMEH